eukprot:TRINITY_DN15382_c0_g2_i2.p1 TRINITY_DN15382_c0_g2~~TRINITY_DN15382_c0_g2_i2.p1  ORF type:complete len:569 (+),score=133.85 TRINITY_DN15382_c0_g2_i2:122-1828(+)
MGGPRRETTGSTRHGSKDPAGSRLTTKERARPGVHCGAYHDVGERLEARVGLVQMSGRYHKQPRTLTSDYIVSDVVLGSGCNGDVRLASSKTFPDHKFAVKDFFFAGVPLCKREQLEMEVEVFLSIDHPHIARLMDVYEYEEHTAMVMEYMQGGELFERLMGQKRLGEQDASSMARQMLLALNYIHQHGIIHGDVKLENFMFDSKESDHLKLIDFGFSKMVTDVSEGATQTKLCGTLSYIAPEALGRKLSSQCDQWSLGVVVFVLLAGYMPFSGNTKEMMRKIAAGDFVMKQDVWDVVSEDARLFTQALLTVDPKVRISAKAALDHPFIMKSTKQKEDVQLYRPFVDALCDFRNLSRFRRCVLSMIAWSLSHEECAKVEQFFLDMDEFHKGAITFEELKKVMVGRFNLSHGEVKKTFEALDTHKDHEIHYSDFLAAMVGHNEIALNDEHVYDAFRRFDTHSAGYITVDNLREVLGDRFDGERVESILREVDPLNLGHITYHEFGSYVRGRPLHLHGDEVVSLSQDDVEKLRSGKGTGYFRPASLRCNSSKTLGGGHSRNQQQACCSVQ